MKNKETNEKQLLEKIHELESRLEESDQLIEAIKSGKIDAFAINENGESEIFTLQSVDYAYRVLIEEFSEGALHVTTDGLIVYSNPYFYELLNLPYEKVVGNYIFDFIHPDSKNEFEQLFEEGLAEKSKGEICLKSNERDIPVYISLTSLQPRLPTVGIIITDLTNKKKNEEIILKYQQDLETNNQTLRHTNSELASFAYIASHDLQEPLRKIQTFATRILEKEFDQLSENGKDHFTRMQNAAKRMQTLIEDLLAYSRTNTVERKFEKTDLKKIIETVKKDMEEELQLKQAIIESPHTCNVKIIPFQFRQLLYNLINNSLKFSRPGHPPHIQIKSEIVNGRKSGHEDLFGKRKYCHINITDNGIGFDQKYNEKIFELFQQLHSKTEYKGTGIGLAIVKKIVENHNGTITATSEPNQGTSFDIYIPA